MASADISIITPSFNQAAFIEQTIRSVRAQENVSVQYIVVDGASSDGSADILQRYASEIDHLIIEADHGQAHALEKGFALASADFCGYLNSDDYYLPGALQRVVGLLRAQPSIDVLYGDRIYVDAEDQLLRYWRLPPHSDFINCRWDFIPQEACFWRRSAMEAAGGVDPSYRFAVDYDLFARMMQAGKRFVHVSEFYAVFRDHPRSKTSSAWEAVGAPEMERVREAYGFRVRPYQMVPAALHYGLLKMRSEWYRWRFPNGPTAFTDRVRSHAGGAS